MEFWFTAALLTLASSLAVLWPLTTRSKDAVNRDTRDIAIYREQLDEIAQDETHGTITADAAREARAEIGRRILRAASLGGRSGLPRPGHSRRIMVAVAVLAVPIVSWSVYGWLGSPELPGAPLADRLAAHPADLTIDELVARAEAHLSNDPEDGKGWDVLAPIYARMGRYDDSITAYRHAIRLSGDSAERQSGLGEALSYAAGGRITSEASRAFEKALALQPTDPKAGFYAATALAQSGRLADAEAAWRGMLPALPDTSPWRGAVTDALAEVQRRTASNSSSTGPAPSNQEVAAASAMPQSDRTAMIERMVAGLDEKLRADPANPDGWMRLVRSYVVLGRTTEAQNALGRGLKALGSANDSGKALASLGASLGLKATD